jgi:hypothetical protein
LTSWAGRVCSTSRCGERKPDDGASSSFLSTTTIPHPSCPLCGSTNVASPRPTLTGDHWWRASPPGDKPPLRISRSANCARNASSGTSTASARPSPLPPRQGRSPRRSRPLKRPAARDCARLWRRTTAGRVQVRPHRSVRRAPTAVRKNCVQASALPRRISGTVPPASVNARLQSTCVHSTPIEPTPPGWGSEIRSAEVRRCITWPYRPAGENRSRRTSNRFLRPG